VQSTVVTVSNLNDLNSAIATIEANTGANDSSDDTAAPTPGPAWTINIDASAAGQTWQLLTHQFNDGEYYTGQVIHGHVTIDASNASGFTLSVSQGGQSSPPLRLFTVYPNASLTLKSLTVNGGNAGNIFGGVGHGGAVRNLGTFTASNVTFSSNQISGGLAYGGAIYNDAGVVTLTGCTFTSNSATGFGGAIASHNGTLTLTDVTFSGNSAPTANDLYVYGDGATATLHLISTSVAGYASATINGGSLVVTGYVAAAPYTINRYGTGSVAIAVNTLLNASTGTGLVFISADATSVNGVPITVAGGVLTYGTTTIRADDSFTYQIHDVNGLTATGTVTVHWIDQPPVAQNATFSRTAGQTLSIPIATLLATATDPDGDAISFVGADGTSALGATVTPSGNVLIYDPGQDGFTGDDTFQYTIQDTYGATATATVTIHTTAEAITPVVTASVQNGATLVTVAGAPSTSYTVSVSSDLVTWTTLGTVVTNALGVGTINDAALPAEATGRYYRISY
jgi:predicted outer membrane repeat protein